MIIGSSSSMLLAAITQMPINTLVKSWTSVVHAPSCHQTRVQTSSPEHCKGCLERPGMARTKPEASTTCVEKCMHTLAYSHALTLSHFLGHSRTHPSSCVGTRRPGSTHAHARTRANRSRQRHRLTRNEQPPCYTL